MSMIARSIKIWINSLPDDVYVGVDDGGLTLVVEDGYRLPVMGPKPYLEIGGIPEDNEEDES